MSATADSSTEFEVLDRRLAEVRRHQIEAHAGRRNLWLAHHWPDCYDDRCVTVGSRPVCRRCLALYPLGFLVAILSAAGLPPWPGRLDPWLVWLLCLPATVAYVGEAVGWFRYRSRWQTAATMVTAVAFGRALGYELLDRWSPIFWGPIAVFGGIWFAATVVGLRRRHRGRITNGQRAATASSSSSSVL